MSPRWLLLAASLGATLFVPCRGVAGSDVASFFVIANQRADDVPADQSFASGISDAASLARLSGRVELTTSADASTPALLSIELYNPNFGLPIGYLDSFHLRLPDGTGFVPGSLTQGVSPTSDVINFVAHNDTTAPLTLSAGGIAFVAESPSGPSPTLAPGSTATFTLQITGVGTDWTLVDFFPPTEDGQSFDFVFRFRQLQGSANFAIFDRVGLQIDTQGAAIPEPLTFAVWLGAAALLVTGLARRR